MLKGKKNNYFILHIVLLIIPLITFVIYSNILSGKFLFDDISSILFNPHIKDLSDVGHIWQFKPSRFFAYLSFAVNYKLGGLNPFYYHLVNIVIHIVNVFLVFVFIRLHFLLTMDRQDLLLHNLIIPFVGALFFAVHPIQTQAVSYIVQRTTSLASLFYLSSLVLFIKFLLVEINKQSAKFCRYVYYGASLITSFCAFHTKENTFTLPLVVTLLLIIFLWKKIQLKRLISFAIPFFIIAYISYFLIQNSVNLPATSVIISDPSHVNPLRSDYILTQMNVVRTYIRLLFFPVGLNLDYDFQVFSNIFEISTIASAFLILLLLGLAIYLYNRTKLISFGILFFFTTLLIESYFPLEDVIAEHRLYLPSVGFFICITGLLDILWKTYKSRRFQYSTSFFLIFIIFFLSFLTYQRNFVWTDEFSLWSDVVKKSPKKARAYANLGLSYRRRDDFENAIVSFNKAIELEPKHVKTYLNLALTYKGQKKLEKAEEILQKALSVDPTNAIILEEFSKLYLGQKKYEEAVALYQQALGIDAKNASLYYGLGNIYSQLKKYEIAKEYYKKATELFKNYVDPRYGLASIYLAEKDFDSAKMELEEILTLNSYHTGALLNMGILYIGEKDYQKGINLLEKYVLLKPDNKDPYYYLGLGYYLLKDKLHAVKNLRKAVSLDPNNAKTREILEEVNKVQ